MESSRTRTALAEPEVQPPGTEMGKPAAVPPFAGRRVLVVDDNPVNRHVTGRLLEKLGCRADLAAEGPEALALHRAFPYDLILMDCDMPGMDGFETTRRIRGMADQAHDVPVLALTALAAPSEHARCLEAGMNGLLAKPIGIPALQQALQGLFRTPAESDAGQRPDDELDAVRHAFGSDFDELARLFQADSPVRIAALREAAAAQDASGLARLAHVLAGSCASIGAPRLANLCRDLEIQIRNRDASQTGVEPMIAAIEAEYRRIAIRLESMMGPAL